jgi:imidazolonepropionase-like amidohydrolase
MRWLGLCGLTAVPLFLTTALFALDQPKASSATTVAYSGARIHTATGAPIEQGILIVRNGKIVAVGGPDTKIPEGAEIVDLRGKVIIPGLVDTHSHIGVYSRPEVPANSDGNEASGPVQGVLRALDAITPDDPGIRMALGGGITTANIMPGSGNVIGGQTLYVKLRGRTVEDMRVTPTTVLGGLKMANGENPKRFNFERSKQPPATRMKLAALQREQFVKAREYQRQWATHRKAKEKDPAAVSPDIDLALEPLVEVLERRRTVHFHTHRADDLMSAMRLADEFGFELVIQHGTEAYRVVEEIVRRKVPVSLTLLDSPGGKPEVAGLLEENAALLAKAGVKVAINTDDSITESRYFLRTGAIAIRGGLDEDTALKALTLHGAEILHLEDRIGSLQPGKDADFVVLSGTPFSVYTQVLQTYIDGVKVFDRSLQASWTYQTGGFALPERNRPALPASPPVARPVVNAPGQPDGCPVYRDNPERFAVFAGRVHTVSSGTIEDGVILVDKGRIQAVGKRSDVKVPPGTPALMAAEVTPGLIDPHTVVGLSGALNVTADQDQDETSDPNGADLRVLDAFNPDEPLLDFLRQQGVTVIHALPGRANVIAGQTGIFRTAGLTVDRMTLRFPAGLLVNLGESPKRGASGGKAPTTRMATASIVRTALAQAQNYARKKAAAKTDDKMPPQSAKNDALALALERKIPVLFAAHRADDIQTALRLGEEFHLDTRLELVTEGYLLADRLAEARVPVVVHPTMQRAGGSMETYHSFAGNAAVLADKKVPLALGSGFEGYVPKSRVIRYEAAVAMVNGLGRDRALAAITLDAAKILHIDDRFGSLEVGKEADLVLYDGDPFEYKTHVTHTLASGKVVWERAEYLKLPYSRRALMIAGAGGGGCCLGQW